MAGENSSQVIDSSLSEINGIGCGCAGCQSGPKTAYVDMSSGDVIDGGMDYAPSQTWTKEDFESYLSEGYWQATGRSERQWGGDTPNVTYNISNEYASNDAQGIRDAFDAWSEMANITFSEVGSGADIRILEGDGALTAYSSYSTYGGSGDIVSDTHAQASHVISVNMYIDDE